MHDNKTRSLLERKMDDPEYRKYHYTAYDVFKLEAQILLTMEHKGWSYADLARATHTSKSNVSRDLKAGGIMSASFSRIARIAEVLGMKLIPVLAPKEHEYSIAQKIEEIVRTSFDSASEEALVTPPELDFSTPAVITFAEEPSYANVSVVQGQYNAIC
ncbi:MAG: helix-turn-helix transcriptional regulator [Elusimicrobiales bacterium]|jgi:transcriptional regulator with XRE-family HTH domain